MFSMLLSMCVFIIVLYTVCRCRVCCRDAETDASSLALLPTSDTATFYSSGTVTGSHAPNTGTPPGSPTTPSSTSHSRSSSPGPGGDESEGVEETKTILIRLGFQLFVLFVIFLVDCTLNVMHAFGGVTISQNIFIASDFLWKCESWVVATLWLANTRVRRAIRQLPWVQHIFCLTDPLSLTRAILKKRYAWSIDQLGSYFTRIK
jgi:hypothetical protein